MVRPLVALAVLALAAPARAGELPHHLGMYPTAGSAALPMLDSQVAVHVRGPIVEAIVTQTFRNDRDDATEATYVFPLPPDAAVSAMAIQTGSRTIHAAIARREDAQHRYEDAVAAGLGAGLLDQERPDVFTQTVSAIPAHGTVRVELRYDTTARYAGGRWELVLPLVVAPRYVPGTASGRPTTGTGRAPDTDRVPDASRVTPGGAPGAGGTTTITLEFEDPVDDVASPTHDLSGEGTHYTLVDPASDHDAIVRWRARVPTEGWVEQDDDGGYAAVVVTAPAAAHPALPASVLVLLDRAATTRGDGDAVEHPLVRALLGALGASDRVAIAGSDRIDARPPDQALRAVEQAWSRPAGAFDLTKVLAATRAGGAAVVLVTDGLVADDRAALAAAREVGAPIHVIGIGPAPNRSLLAAIATTTGGTVRFAVAGDDLAGIARDALADAAAPPAPLAVSWGTLAASDVVPGTLPRVGAGQAVLVLARVARAEHANARARGDVFALATVDTPRPPAGATTPRGPLARRWARMKLDELIAAGDPRAIATHALHYGLVSPLTSMIALGDEVVVQGGVKHTIAVPVSVPAGMRWQEVRRQTAVKTQQEKDKVSDTPATRVSERDHAHGKAPGRTTTAATKSAKPAEPTPAKREPSPDVTENKPSAGDEDDGADDTRFRAGTVAPAAPTSPPPVAAGPQGTESKEAEPTERLETATADESGGEAEEMIEVAGARERARRLALGVGGGIAIERARGAFASSLSLRYEFGTRTLLGVEGSAWLVDGNLEGTVLATVARRGLAPWLELGGGLGLHVGDGLVGPAVDLVLRTRLPVRHLGLYLRYDGALLFHDGTKDGQNTTTLGIEAHW